MAKFERKAFSSLYKVHIFPYYKKLIKTETSCSNNEAVSILCIQRSPTWFIKFHFFFPLCEWEPLKLGNLGIPSSSSFLFFFSPE